MASAPLRIGDLARATDTSVVTIRYYERIGLLPAPPRDTGNYRTYDEGALRRLGFIRRCRGLGFSLDEVRALLALAQDAAHPCDAVDRITATHLEDVERKIADLSRLAGELRRIAASCRGAGPIHDCRIIEALSDGGGGAAADDEAAEEERLRRR